MKKRYKSDALEALHGIAQDLYEVGAIADKRKAYFDKACLVQEDEISPEEIYKIRTESKVAQSTFAEYLSVSKTVISAWERGTKKPSGTAKRLLRIVQRHGIGIIQETISGKSSENSAYSSENTL